MPAPNLFAYDPIGSVLVVFDGKEVLVHRGADEAPRWRHNVEGELAGLGAGGDTVITLEAQGKLIFWSGADGVVVETIALGEAARSLAVTRNGSACAIVVDGAILVVTRGSPSHRIDAAGATAAAWSRDGARLAIGDASGAVRIVSSAGDAVGATKLEEPVASLCFSPAGFWIATGGDRIFRVAEDGASVEQITRAGGMAPDCVCASTDGSMFAVRLSETVMIALALPSRDTAVQLVYMDRKIAGVAFGPDRLLGVGLLDGDGNIVDITEKQLRRTDTFPGRTHNRWMVSTTIKPEVLPPAPARAALRQDSPGEASASPGGLPLAGWLGILGALIAFAIALSMCR
jgi:WD40 repeat protein